MSTREPRRAWPPLVGVDRVPLLIRVRDTALTLLDERTSDGGGRDRDRGGDRGRPPRRR